MKSHRQCNEKNQAGDAQQDLFTMEAEQWSLYLQQQITETDYAEKVKCMMMTMFLTKNLKSFLAINLTNITPEANFDSFIQQLSVDGN